MSESYISLATKLGLSNDEELTSYDLETISTVVGLEVMLRGWSRQTVADLTGYDVAVINNALDRSGPIPARALRAVASHLGLDRARFGRSAPVPTIDNGLDISGPVQAAALGAVADELGLDLVRSGRSVPDLSLALAEALVGSDAHPSLVALLPRGRVADDFHMLALAFTGSTAPDDLTARYNLTLGFSLVANALENGADFSARFALEGLVEDAEAGLFAVLGPFERRR